MSIVTRVKEFFNHYECTESELIRRKREVEYLKYEADLLRLEIRHFEEYIERQRKNILDSFDS